MKQFITPYRVLAQIRGSDFMVPLYQTQDNKHSLCNCIDGYAENGPGVDFLTINIVDENLPHITKVNRYGFIEVTYNDKVYKRHISNCEDLQGLFMTEPVQDIIDCGMFGNKICKNKNTRISNECYVLIDSNGRYLSRVQSEDKTTEDITCAWFTFIKSQAENYAIKLNNMFGASYRFEPISSIIQLDLYEIE